MSEARVAMLPANSADGCSYWRLWMPHLRTPESRYFSQAPVPFKALVGCNVVVVQRLASHENYATLEKFKKIGLGIIYDLDDDMWAIAASNPAAPIIKRLRGVMAGFDECSKLADVVTLSTGRLEASVKTNMRHGGPTRGAMNAVEMALFRPSLLPKNPNRVVIGWGGSATHSEDLREMGDAPLALLRAEPKAFLHFVGMIPDKRYIGNPRILAHGWVPGHEYAARLSTWNWDVYLAPLTDSRFNRAKSGIKAYEAGALKIPCLMSDVQPHREFVCHDKELEWLLCSKPNEWFDKLRELVQNRELREHLGQRCYEVVREHFSMVKRAPVWKAIYDSVVKK